MTNWQKSRKTAQTLERKKIDSSMDKKKTESTKDYRESFQKLLMSLGAPE